MGTILTYTHTRDLFTKNEFKPFVKKYFKDVEFLGCETGNWYPQLKVSNYEDVKHQLPKSYLPIEAQQIN